MTTPFFYIIEHKSGKKYAGIKFAKGCHPSDLLTNYFTSSKVVKSLLEEDANSFSIEEIIVFDDKDELIEFEIQFLKGVNAHLADDWLNLSAGKAINPEVAKKTCLEKYGVDNWMKGAFDNKPSGFHEGNTLGCFKRSQQTRELISKANKGKVVSEETRAKLSAAKLGSKASEATKAKFSEQRKRGKHPKAVKVSTPCGVFDCLEDAADFYEVSSSAIRKWLKTKPEEFFKLQNKD